MQKKKISIVDDIEDNRVIMRAILQREFDVTDYADGPTALRHLVTDPPDLLLLDISMPVMDGYEVLQRLRADPHLAGLPVVAFTAFATPYDVRRYQEVGFDHCIGKPILDIEGMLAQLRGLLGGRAVRHLASSLWF